MFNLLGWKRLVKLVTLFKLIIVGKIDKSTLKLRTSSHEKTSLREWESQSRCLQFMQLTNDSYPEYVNNWKIWKIRHLYRKKGILQVRNPNG